MKDIITIILTNPDVRSSAAIESVIIQHVQLAGPWS
jgi:hypothetical protein